MKKVLSGFNSDVEVQWVQEEHENYGAWNYISQRLHKTLGKSVKFFGRKPSAATAVGALKLHKI